MRATKNWIGLVAAFLPVLFCGGFLLYFNEVRSAGLGLFDRALGPTMFGLGAFGVLFLILFLVKLWKLLAPPPPGPGALAAAALEAEKSDFDADAALARYLARHADDRPTSFGRKRS